LALVQDGVLHLPIVGDDDQPFLFLGDWERMLISGHGRWSMCYPWS
jgi:hypothetical protein